MIVRSNSKDMFSSIRNLKHRPKQLYPFLFNQRQARPPHCTFSVVPDTVGCLEGTHGILLRCSDSCHAEHLCMCVFAVSRFFFADLYIQGFYIYLKHQVAHFLTLDFFKLFCIFYIIACDCVLHVFILCVDDLFTAYSIFSVKFRLSVLFSWAAPHMLYTNVIIMKSSRFSYAIFASQLCTFPLHSAFMYMIYFKSMFIKGIKSISGFKFLLGGVVCVYHVYHGLLLYAHMYVRT